MINQNLFNGIEADNIEAVKKILSEEKLNAATFYGAKSIIIAVENEQIEILETLLESSKNIDRESFWQRTAQRALCLAIQKENIEMIKLLLDYGAATDKKILNNSFILNAIKAANSEIKSLMIKNGFRKNCTSETVFNNHHNKTEKFCKEDGIILPEKYSRENIFIQYAKEGKISKVKEYLTEGVDNELLLEAMDAALKKDRWKTANVILDYCSEIEIYTECLKKMFLQAAYTEDLEKVKLYLEKLIENAVGVFTDETGKSTLEIALENSPEDIIKILSNYDFHENTLRHAFNCLTKIKK